MLTRRQKAFVDHYLTCRNGAEAARRAGYAEPSARITASKLLTKGNIQVALAEKEAEIKKITNIDKKRVVNELMAAIDLARVQANAGRVINGWMNVANILGLDKPEPRKTYVPSASQAVIIEKLKNMNTEELFLLAQGDLDIKSIMR